MFPEDAENESDPDDENDDLDVVAHEKKQTVKVRVVFVCKCAEWGEWMMKVALLFILPQLAFS